MHVKFQISGRSPSPVESTDRIESSLRTNNEGQPIWNRVLLALPEEEFDSVRPLLAFERYRASTNLYDRGETAEFVHFLNRGLASIVVVTQQGKTVEAGVVGKEGMLGMPGLAGFGRSPHRVVVQIPGDGFRVPVGAAQDGLSRTPAMQGILWRYAIVQGLQAAQSAACNRLHGVEQRLARWLLTVHDRAAQDAMHITHEFLATLLGTDRPSVSLAAGDLQKKGAIEYTRGQLRIAIREKLEEATCECYAAIRTLDLDLQQQIMAP